MGDTCEIPALIDGEMHLSQKGLDNIARLAQRLTRDVELGSANAHQNSVTATLRFKDKHGPFEQSDALGDLVSAAMCVVMLVENLQAERNHRAEVSS